MGYLDNQTITVEAILTKKGRELLARGDGFEITQFAVADDEIDYSLWTATHPLGTAYYGSVIESLPLVEAVPDETQVMRYKLVTLPRGTKTIPIIDLGFPSLTLVGADPAKVFKPTTANNLNGSGYGYTATLYDSDAATLVGSGLPDNFAASAPSFLGDQSTANAVVVVGTEFTITPKDVASAISTKLTVVGNQTGGSVTIPVTVNPKPTT